jgi:glucosylceramidase
VDTINKTYKYNYEYYLMKHLSHFVKPGARRLNTSGSFNDLLAFKNPDKSIALIIRNDGSEIKKVTIELGDQMISPSLPPDSFNTLIIKEN